MCHGRIKNITMTQGNGGGHTYGSRGCIRQQSRRSALFRKTYIKVQTCSDLWIVKTWMNARPLLTHDPTSTNRCTEYVFICAFMTRLMMKLDACSATIVSVCVPSTIVRHRKRSGMTILVSTVIHAASHTFGVRVFGAMFFHDCTGWCTMQWAIYTANR
jgi:hypothetical protein